MRTTDISESMVATFLEYATYSPETGRMAWIKSPNSRAPVGADVGSVNSSDGYRYAQFKGVTFLVHRMAWTLANGKIPDGLSIDHINGDILDNRAVNLRAVPHGHNMQNQRRPRKDNKSSGILGVRWHKGDQRWQARIQYKGKTVHLGSFRFEQKEEARQAYLEAKRKLHPGCTI